MHSLRYHTLVIRSNSNMKRSSILTIIIFLFTNCSEVIEYELPYDGDKIVVNAILLANEPVQVSITKSAPPTGEINKDLSLKSATIDLFENGVFIESLEHTNDGIYISKSEFRPVEGNEYYFVVNAKGFETVSSIPTIIPSSPSVSLLGVTYNPFSEESKGVQTSIVITDPIAEENYYFLTVYGLFNGDDSWYETYSYLLGVSYDFLPPCLDNIILGDLYKDACQNGGDFEFIFNTENKYSSPGNNRDEFDKLFVTVTNISTEYYNYLLNYDRVTDIQLIFFEPEVLPSNIMGGYGIVGAGNQAVIEIVL